MIVNTFLILGCCKFHLFSNVIIQSASVCIPEFLIIFFYALWSFGTWAVMSLHDFLSIIALSKLCLYAKILLIPVVPSFAQALSYPLFSTVPLVFNISCNSQQSFPIMFPRNFYCLFMNLCKSFFFATIFPNTLSLRTCSLDGILKILL